jgi:hypothetical protein
MKAHSRLVLFSLITILVFLFNLALPVAAFADDGAPPDAAPTESPVVTTDTSPADAAPAADATPVDLPAVLEQVPADTQVVVVNDAGQAEPLATTAAAEILQTGDPVWCPSTQLTPTPGLNGCTLGHTAMTDLLDELSTDAGATYNGAGTIWIESIYDGSTDGSVTIDQADTSVYDLSYLSDLGIQGYQANAADPAVPTITVPVYLNWLHNVSLHDLAFIGDDSFAALTVITDGDIDVNNVTVTGNPSGTGAYLDTCQYDGSLCTTTAASRDITVSGSTFTGNHATGLMTDSGGSTTLTNVTARSNGFEGVYAFGQDDSAVTHDVTVNGGVFRDNDTGIRVQADGNVALNNVDASGLYDAPATTWSLRNNTGALIETNTGAYGDATPGTGSITVNGGHFNGNFWYGLVANSAGDITVNNAADVSNNSLPGHDTSGAYLDATYGNGVISVSDSTFNGNDGYGLFGIAHNNITLTNLTVDGGGITDVGAWIKAINGTATVDGGLSGVFTNTTKTGLIAIGGVQVDLVNLNVTANAGDGAQVYSTFTYACFGSTGILVNVNNGDYSGNSGPGLTIKPGPDGSVTVTGSPKFDLDDAMVVDLGNPCLGSDEEKPEEGKPVNIVEVPFKDGAPVLQDCTTYSGTALVLPDGTWVKFGCPFDGSVSLEGLLKDELPGPLGAGATFVSAVSYGMTGLDNALVTVNPDGTITIKFKIPADSKARAYDILYWDPTANNGAGGWVILPQSKFGQPQAVSLHPDDPEDGRLITRGVRQKDGYVTVTVNFTGIFVLVAR